MYKTSNVKLYMPGGKIMIARWAVPGSSVEVAEHSAQGDREEELFMSPSSESSGQFNKQHSEICI